MGGQAQAGRSLDFACLRRVLKIVYFTILRILKIAPKVACGALGSNTVSNIIVR